MKLDTITDTYHPLIERIIRESRGIKYSALFLEPNPAVLKQVGNESIFSDIRKAYFLGILERCHLTCVTSLARADRWLHAALVAKRDENVLGFASALRGFLEAASDAYDILKFLPESIYKLFPYIHLVFSDSDVVARTMLTLKEFEENLIHYAYAKRKEKGTTPLPNHENKSAAEYIRQIESFGASDASRLYSELCELTHPAAPSIFCFLREESDSISFDAMQDAEIITSILNRYEHTVDILALSSLNPALTTLCYLHRINESWPAPSDDEMEQVGRTKQRLESMDKFVSDFEAGTLNVDMLSNSMT